MTTTVALVDDHGLFREGLRNVLASTEFEVVSEAADGVGAQMIASTVQPSIMTIDVSLGSIDGITVARAVMDLSPKTRVLMLTMHTGEFFVSRALGAGVRGYATKIQPTSEIMAALRMVARGEIYVPPQYVHLVTGSRSKERGGAPPLELLSAREREVFSLIIQGASNVAIATSLSISVKTVETHRIHINKKLLVHSTGELMRLAAVYGLLGSDRLTIPPNESWPAPKLSRS